MKLRPTYEHIKRGVSSEAKLFINKLLAKDKSQRLFGRDCLHDKWLISDHMRQLTDVVLDTALLRSYLARQRWAKAIKAVRATVKMQRMVCSIRAADSVDMSIPIQVELLTEI